MTDNNKAYDELISINKEISIINSILALLGWDEQTYMPTEGAEYRGDQTAYFSGLAHSKSTDPRIGDLLAELETAGFEGDKLDPQSVNVREWRKDYDLGVKLPQSLVEEMSKTIVLSQHAWMDARSKKDFSIFQPHLEKVVELQRQKAECFGYTTEAYDALLNLFEPGAISSDLEITLNSLRDELVPMLQKISDATNKPDSTILYQDFPIDKQEAFAKEVAAGIGYDFDRGSLNVTAHPFMTGLGPNDLRITTRYYPKYLNGALFGVIHEAGHAMYEQNLLAEYYATPLGESVSMGIHESQSRMWENNVARGMAFWEHWYPTAQKYFTALNGVKLDDFYRAINEIKPSFIRVEADELTYNLHILLRFEIERELIRGNLKVEDLPGYWNENFNKYFDLDVPDDSQGCMQDVHWGAGLFGYFPTYSLGTLNAAQFYAQAESEIGDLDAMFRVGEFSKLRNWLTEKIHTQGRRFMSQQLTKEVTGRDLDSVDLINYLKGKLYPVYGI